MFSRILTSRSGSLCTSYSSVKSYVHLLVLTAQANLAQVAYNYLGIAIRLAYSTGINENMRIALLSTAENQLALRTWWTLYSLESEICVEYGRPLCIRETDAKAAYPQETLVSTPGGWILQP